MSKPWGGGIGAWAAEAERADAEEREAAAALAAAGVSARVEPQSFPSLREAAAAKPKKKKMSLNEFNSVGSRTGGASGGRGSESTRLTTDEMFRLPTGPKERSAEEMQYGRLGGGFSNYGGGRSGMRDRDDEGSWGGGGGRRQYGGFDDERRGPPSRVSDLDQPSRADENDNWAMGKKSLPSFDSRQSRYGSLAGGSGGGAGAGDFGGSRADGADNWGTGKKHVPVRSSTFGSGFRDSGPEPDRWSRGGTLEPERDRPRLVLNPPKGDIGTTETVKSAKPNPFGAARPREEILAEKGLDWKKLELELDTKKVSSSQSSRPTSAHSSRPSSAHSNRSEGIGMMQQGLENVGAKPRPKVNPFGDAKPREVLLQERGKDWKKIDLELEHRAVDRPETEEEKVLKEEIEHLKKKLEQQSLQQTGGEQPSLQDQLSQRENDLEMLIHDLDDKVRYGQKAVERPGSGAGRPVYLPERPPSQSGSFGESRSMEFIDRPRSRGTQEILTGPGDDRRSFQGGREGGFLGNRDFDRPRSGGKW